MEYYMLQGIIRILIAFTTLIIAWYIWIFSDDIVIFRRSDEAQSEEQSESHGEEVITTREGGLLHFKE
jgi:hypothetical protein